MGDWIQVGVFTYVKKKASLKKQFILYAILSILVATFISIGLICFFIILSYDMKVMTSIEHYADRNKLQIVKHELGEEWEKRREKANVHYWTIEKDKKTTFSTLHTEVPRQVVLGMESYSLPLIDEIHHHSYIYSYKPLINKGEFEGAVILRYEDYFLYHIGFLYNLTEKMGYELFFNSCVFFPIVLLAPIITIAILSYQFSKGITDPLKEIINASSRITNNELDFSIDTSYDNEMGLALKAFENMRSTLEDSLKAQWSMTEQRKDMILALTHDIKTPITIICGHLELLTGSFSDITEEQKEKSLKTLVTHADRVKRLIQELNEVWDLERPEFVLHKKEVRLTDFLIDIEDKFMYLCKQKEVIFSIIHSFDAECRASFDSFRVGEVIENIVSNAIKHTSTGDSIRLEVFFINRSLTFIVTDSGVGFAEQELAVIFTKYRKGNNSGIHKSSAGLGLYICKLIVEKHEGTIKAYNHSEGGAVIEFTIPV
ncbi:Alkaline phosphatase synthesis sensor protein PhoR [Brevibacillus laterosporus]|nr:Alkaline phosphatase synthesis sensor protein PhoR [Brevibacillus laterosporus]